MSLYDLYNGSLNAFYDGNLTQAASSVYEYAFFGMWPYYFLFMTITMLIFIRNRNLGILGVSAGCLAEGLMQLGKFPPYFHIGAYLMIGVSVGLTLYLFFTERDTG